MRGKITRLLIGAVVLLTGAFYAAAQLDRGGATPTIDPGAGDESGGIPQSTVVYEISGQNRGFANADWTPYKNWSFPYGANYAQCYYGDDQNSWLASPSIELKSNKKYRIEFEMNIQTVQWGTEKVEWTVATGSTESDLDAGQRIWQDEEFDNVPKTLFTSDTFTVSADGNYNFGCHIYSHENIITMFLYNFKVIEYPGDETNEEPSEPELPAEIEQYYIIGSMNNWDYSDGNFEIVKTESWNGQISYNYSGIFPGSENGLEFELITALGNQSSAWGAEGDVVDNRVVCALDDDMSYTGNLTEGANRHFYFPDVTYDAQVVIMIAEGEIMMMMVPAPPVFNSIAVVDELGNEFPLTKQSQEYGEVWVLMTEANLESSRRGTGFHLVTDSGLEFGPEEDINTEELLLDGTYQGAFVESENYWSFPSYMQGATIPAESLYIASMPGQGNMIQFTIQSKGAVAEYEPSFIAGSMNNWVPNDPNYALEKTEMIPGMALYEYSGTFPASAEGLEFVITGGSMDYTWGAVGEIVDENKVVCTLDDGAYEGMLLAGSDNRFYFPEVTYDAEVMMMIMEETLMIMVMPAGPSLEGAKLVDMLGNEYPLTAMTNEGMTMYVLMEDARLDAGRNGTSFHIMVGDKEYGPMQELEDLEPELVDGFYEDMFEENSNYWNFPTYMNGATIAAGDLYIGSIYGMNIINFTIQPNQGEEPDEEKMFLVDGMGSRIEMIQESSWGGPAMWTARDVELPADSQGLALQFSNADGSEIYGPSYTGSNPYVNLELVGGMAEAYDLVIYTEGETAGWYLFEDIKETITATVQFAFVEGESVVFFIFDVEGEEGEYAFFEPEKAQVKADWLGNNKAEVSITLPTEVIGYDANYQNPQTLNLSEYGAITKVNLVRQPGFDNRTVKTWEAAAGESLNPGDVLSVVDEYDFDLTKTYKYAVTVTFTALDGATETSSNTVNLVFEGGEEQELLPATNLKAVNDGDAITITWDAPAVADPSAIKGYFIYVNDKVQNLIAFTVRTFDYTYSEDDGDVLNIQIETEYASGEKVMSETLQYSPVGVFELWMENGAAEFYTLQGHRVKNAEAGIYIMVKDGKSQKVFIRK